MKITLLDTNMMGADTIVAALSMCRDNQCDYSTITHCMEAKPIPHLAAMEMCWFAFRVSGVSVKLRIQLERHRHFSSMERSTRSINMSEAECIIPPTAKEPKVFGLFFRWALNNYRDLLELGESEEDASYVLPLGVETKFVLAENGRVWFEYLNKRLCRKHVQPEHYRFARELYKQLVKIMPAMKYCHPCRDCPACRNSVTV